MLRKAKVVASVPAIFMARLTRSYQFSYVQHYDTSGNVIDIIVMQDCHTLVYSMDAISTPLSTTKIGNQISQVEHGCMGAITAYPGRQKEECKPDSTLKTLRLADDHFKTLPRVKGDEHGKSLRDTLCGLENLRKRGGEESHEV